MVQSSYISASDSMKPILSKLNIMPMCPCTTYLISTIYFAAITRMSLNFSLFFYVAVENYSIIICK